MLGARTRGLILAVVVLGACGVAGCGSSAPREADIYHDPGLRPGVVHADAHAEAILARLPTLDGAGTLEVGGASVRVDAPYHAASGRSCRTVHAGGDARLACDGESGWVFVPAVLPTVTAEVPREGGEAGAEP